MSQAVQRYDLSRHVWLNKIIQIVNAAKFSNFCCWFSLRQGTIIIAVVELSLSSFCLFLLLLGITHAQDIVSLVTSELHQLEQKSNAAGRSDESSVYVLNNEKKMLLGRHLAFIIMVTVWTGIILTGISIISSSLLLYGAIRNSPKFLLPWTSTAFLSLISGSFFIFMLTLIPFKGCKLGLFVVVIFFYALESYAWLVVLSYYQQLKALQLKNPSSIALYAKTAGEKIIVSQIQHETC